MKNNFYRPTIALAAGFVWLTPFFCFCSSAMKTDEADHVQCHLKHDEVILRYAVTDSIVNINAVSQGSSFEVVQTVDQLFWGSVKSYLKKLKSAENRDFPIHGQILYLYLIKPVEQFIADKHRLIISPGSRLADLPFEAFIRNDNNGSDNQHENINYLICDYEIVYQCAGDRIREQPAITSPGKKVNTQEHHVAFMGFSPGFKGNNSLGALPGSYDEVKEIGSLFRRNGQSTCLVFGEDSEKHYFKRIASMGAIVHLATHYTHAGKGQAGPGLLFCDSAQRKDNGSVAFSMLTMDELQALKLNADLIVLNGCATGVIEESGGNSLPQVLIQTGTRNILSTLWNVTDNLASRFMIDFYRACLSGKTYSEALREVKLNWIKRTATTIPTIWAAYVLMGQ